MKIYAPNKAYTGVSVGVAFNQGVGETEDPAALNYFARAGYGMGQPVPDPADVPATIDARDWAEPHPIGTKLRDAAVNPRASDFLPPTNAGEANPHGPLVVSPGLHAVPPAPIVPGPVSPDAKTQQALEMQAAEAVLVEGAPADIVAVEDGDQGPLGLSDPASAVAGVEAAADARPAKSANKDAWVAYALSQGMSPDEANATSKAGLVERFGE